MSAENPAETRAWIGADVPPEQAREWIAARLLSQPKGICGRRSGNC